MPNCLRSAPRNFTKMTKVIFAEVQNWKQGFMSTCYTDDCLLLGRSGRECMQNVRAAVEMSENAGFVIHPEKSQLQPESWLRIRYPVKTSQNQNVPSDLPKHPFLVSQNVPSIFSLYLIKLEIANISCPKVKTSQVKTSQSQNVPSQNVPKSKRPKSKRPKSKCPKVKTSQVKMSHSQNVPSCLSACKQHYSHSYEALY